MAAKSTCLHISDFLGVFWHGIQNYPACEFHIVLGHFCYCFKGFLEFKINLNFL